MEPQPKNNLGMIIGLTVLASAIVFGGLGYYLAQMGDTTMTDETTATATPTSAVSASPTSSVSATPLSTATWKTYTSTSYGYSVKYPDTDGWKSYLSGGNDGTFVGFCRETACQDSRAYVQVNNESVETLLNASVPLDKNKKNFAQKSITFLGLPATQITYTTEFGGESMDSKTIYVAKGGKTYTIGGTVKDTYSPKDGIFEELLSTFKFN